MKTGDESLDAYLREISRIPLLSRAAELTLANAAAAGSTDARDKLLRANLRFVVRIAKAYRSSRMPLSDLIGEGNVGLIEAIERFDASRGNRFLTYAVWRIRQSIQRAVNDRSRMIRLPDHRANAISRLQRAAAELRARDGREPTLDETATWLGMQPEAARLLTERAREVTSLDAPAFPDGGNTALAAGIADPSESTEGRVFHRLLCGELGQLLATLSKREADIITRRYGLSGAARMTLKEIAGRYRLSSERIRQLEQQALATLREPAHRDRLQEYLVPA